MGSFMKNRTDFFKKHAILFIGIILYLIVYIISCKYDPWEYRSKIGLTTTDIVEADKIRKISKSITDRIKNFFSNILYRRKYL